MFSTRHSIRSAVGAFALVGALLAGCGGDELTEAVVTEVDGGPDAPLFDHTVTWTGDAALIVGGNGSDDRLDGALVSAGRQWNAERGWRSIGSPPGPARNRHAAVWTGTELIIWAGSSAPFGIGDGLMSSAAAYDPSADRWRSLADSPASLARVWGDGAMAGRYAVFAGEDGPVPLETVAIYDTELDAWSEIHFGGPTLAVAGADSAAFVLGLRGDGFVTVASVPGDGASGDGHSLGPELVTSWQEGDFNRADIAVIGDQAAIVILGPGGGSLLTASILDADAPGGPSLDRWTEVDVDVSANPLMNRRLGIAVVGDRLVWASPEGLAWLSLDGELVVTPLDPTIACAAEAGSVAVGDALLAIGGNCTRTTAGGTVDLYGSFLIEAPAEAG